MEISFSTMFFHDHPLDLIFDAVRRSGADTLEFWPETPDWWLSGLPEDRLNRVVRQYPLPSRLSVHAPVLDLNPCSINPDVVEVSIRWIQHSIRLAESLGAAVCTIHPGRRTSKRPPTELDYHRLDHMLDAIADLATSSPVSVAIENMEPQVNALLTTPEEISDLLEDRKWLSVTLDACHVSSRGSDVLDEFLSVAEGRIANVHLSGASGSVMHLPVKGNPWAERSLKSLADAGYDGLVTLEINDLSVGDPLSADEKIRMIAEDVRVVRDHLA